MALSPEVKAARQAERVGNTKVDVVAALIYLHSQKDAGAGISDLTEVLREGGRFHFRRRIPSNRHNFKSINLATKEHVDEGNISTTIVRSEWGGKKQTVYRLARDPKEIYPDADF